MNRLDMATRLVERARKFGADEAEAFVMESMQTEIDIRNGRPESVSSATNAGYGIRVLKESRMGFASCNNLDLKEADEVLARLITRTRMHTPDEDNVLPDPFPGARDGRDLERYDRSLSAVPVEKKIEKAIAIGTAAKNADARIIQIPWLQYGDSVRQFAIVSSRGMSGRAERSEAFGFTLALASEPSDADQNGGEGVQTGMGVGVTTFFDELDPEIIGRKAAVYAARMLGAVTGRTADLTGVFPPETGHNFINLIAEMVNADLVQKKKSLFTGKLGETVASPLVTIIDDGRLPGGLATMAVDAEGVPTTTKEIISAGRLAAFLHDSYTAHRGGTVSTGNAFRRSFDSKPSIMPANFYLKAGTISRETLLASVKDGLFVTEVSALHASVDKVTGDFSIPAKGILIRNGELTTPTTGITISGNIFEFLKGIDAVADDFTWEPREYAIGTPTFRVDRIKVSGA